MLYILVTICTSGCAVLHTSYYSKPVNYSTESNLLLKGDSWGDWKGGYALSNVHQIDTSRLSVAVLVRNHYLKWWATGIWIIPFIPLFGCREGYERNNGSVEITVAVFSKDARPVVIDPCRIRLSIKGLTGILPSQYRYDYDTIAGPEEQGAHDKKNNYYHALRYECKCTRANHDAVDVKFKQGTRDMSGDTDITTKGGANNLLIIELLYPLHFSPKEPGEMVFPEIQHGSETIQIPAFKFEKGKKFYWSAVL